MSFPAIPSGYGVPLVDLTDDLPPAAMLDALDGRYTRVEDTDAINDRVGAGIAYRSTDSSVTSGTSETQATLTTSEVTGCVTFADDEFTITEDGGFYQVTAKSTFEKDSAGRRAVFIYVNNATNPYDASSIAQGYSGNSTTVLVSAIMKLDAGDTVQLYRWQSSGSTLDETFAYLSISRVA